MSSHRVVAKSHFPSSHVHMYPLRVASPPIRRHGFLLSGLQRRSSPLSRRLYDDSRSIAVVSSFPFSWCGLLRRWLTQETELAFAFNSLGTRHVWHSRQTTTRCSASYIYELLYTHITIITISTVQCSILIASAEGGEKEEGFQPPAKKLTMFSCFNLSFFPSPYFFFFLFVADLCISYFYNETGSAI
jgi:hypothetical protein